MRVVVDEEKCTAAGQCLLAAPAVFDQRDDNGVVILLDAEPPEAERARVLDAIARCPAAAIWLEEE